MFSKACEYGIKAAVFICRETMNGRHVSLKEVAHKVDSPEAFTSKILQALARDGIVESVRGAGGGYRIPGERLDRIALCEIVESIDGDRIYVGCGLGLSECDASNPCPLHSEFAGIRDRLRRMLERTRISELARKTEAGAVVLKR